MSWFKRKTLAVAEQAAAVVETVITPQSDVPLAVDSLNSRGRFASVIEVREVPGGFEVTGIATDDDHVWVAAVGFIETLIDSEFARGSSGGGLIFLAADAARAEGAA